MLIGFGVGVEDYVVVNFGVFDFFYDFVALVFISWILIVDDIIYV